MPDELPPTTPALDAGVDRTRTTTFASRVIAGRYVLEQMLGAGGQAEVWEASYQLGISLCRFEFGSVVLGRTGHVEARADLTPAAARPSP